MRNKGKKLKKKKSLGQLFLKTMLITFIVLGVVIGGLILAYNTFLYNGDGLGGSNKTPDPINKTLAVFGVDEDGYRTDVIFVVNYNSETNKTRVISIPRDTKVNWSEGQKQVMAERKGYSVDVSKINEMTSYAGIENIRTSTIDEIENMLGIEVDNYVIITIDAFRQIVDAIGGVEVDVPALDGNGLHYDDNYAGLHIHLDPGLQVLNGEQAEGLVRFRKGYPDGDVGRIRTQQLFLDAFAKKVTSPSIITKIPGIINTIFKTVKTDIKLGDIPGYLPYLNSIDSNNLSFNIIPGEGAYEKGKSYFFPDTEALPEFIREIFDDSKESEIEDEVIVNDKTVSIEVLNATGIQGAAGAAESKLENDGYNVEEIGNATLEDTSRTIIYAKEIEKGKQFEAYYPNGILQEKVDMGYDIQIILGDDIQQ